MSAVFRHIVMTHHLEAEQTLMCAFHTAPHHRFVDGHEKYHVIKNQHSDHAAAKT